MYQSSPSQTGWVTFSRHLSKLYSFFSSSVQPLMLSGARYSTPTPTIW